MRRRVGDVGRVPANGDAYGLDEDSIPPFMRDGFTRWSCRGGAVDGVPL